MKIKSQFLIFALSVWILLVMAQNAEAAEIASYSDTTVSYGMGGVHVLRPNDPGTIFVNPGMLGFNEGMSWTIFNLGAAANGLELATSLSGVSSISASNLSSLYGKPVNIGAGGYTSIVFPYFGFAIYDNASGYFQLNNPAFPNMDFKYYNDYAAVLGTGFSIGKVFGTGVNFKRITRAGVNKTYGPESMSTLTSSTLTSDIGNEGTGYGLDAGMVFRIPAPFTPTISLAWKDIGSIQFIRSKGTVTPDSIRDNLVMGVLFSGDVPGMGLAGGLEYRNITLQGEQLGKKIHLGLEATLALLSARVGFYQGYTTYGISADVMLAELDAAIYSVETGAYPGQSASARQQIQLSLTFTFNPDFSLDMTKTGGRRRNLKQRR